MNSQLAVYYVVSFIISAAVWPPVYYKLKGYQPDSADRTWIGLVSVVPILNSISAAFAVAILLGFFSERIFK